MVSSMGKAEVFSTQATGMKVVGMVLIMLTLDGRVKVDLVLQNATISKKDNGRIMYCMDLADHIDKAIKERVVRR
jgi:hypothetical protein